MWASDDGRFPLRPPFRGGFEAIETIAKASAAAGKPWGAVSRGPAYAERMREWGCRLFVVAADIHVVHAGIRDVKARYASFFPPRA